MALEHPWANKLLALALLIPTTWLHKRSFQPSEGAHSSSFLPIACGAGAGKHDTNTLEYPSTQVPLGADPGQCCKLDRSSPKKTDVQQYSFDRPRSLDLGFNDRIIP
ncbi:hypothetical protein IWZ03DRAFT_163309 [Phyllosticta citriasiana]|uniref:Uncharacterized protein n=1 Tax=Phyllosticta citriasiana TaxID=595635 RepID=A0ABR1KQ48_9PEZI